jgi:hypothetical protein
LIHETILPKYSLGNLSFILDPRAPAAFTIAVVRSAPMQRLVRAVHYSSSQTQKYNVRAIQIPGTNPQV